MPGKLKGKSDSCKNSEESTTITSREGMRPGGFDDVSVGDCPGSEQPNEVNSECGVRNSEWHQFRDHRALFLQNSAFRIPYPAFFRKTIVPRMTGRVRSGGRWQRRCRLAARRPKIGM